MGVDCVTGTKTRVEKGFFEGGGKRLTAFLCQMVAQLDTRFKPYFMRRLRLVGKEKYAFSWLLSVSGRALREEEEIISFLKIPELAQLGEASGEQGANREGGRLLARSPGQEDGLGCFPRGPGGLPLAGSKATMKPQK